MLLCGFPVSQMKGKEEKEKSRKGRMEEDWEKKEEGMERWRDEEGGRGGRKEGRRKVER